MLIEHYSCDRLLLGFSLTLFEILSNGSVWLFSLALSAVNTPVVVSADTAVRMVAVVDPLKETNQRRSPDLTENSAE